MAYRSGTSTAYSSGTAPTIAVPTGAAVDDIAIIETYVEWSSGTITPPSGFTLEGSAIAQTGIPWLHYRYWKRLTAADTGNYAFTISPTDNWLLVCGLWSGRATSGSPFDTGSGASVSAGTTNSTSDIACPSLSMTPTTAGVDLVYGVMNYANGMTTGKLPAGWSVGGLHADGGAQAYKDNQAATATGSVLCSTNDKWTVGLSALLPAGAGGSTAPPSLVMAPRSQRYSY